MPFAYRIPFEADFHAQEVKRACGLACYGALVEHYGSESPKQLELDVDNRRGYENEGEKSNSNKFLRWRQGKALPGEDTIDKLDGVVDLAYWKYHPLWEFLKPRPPAITRIHTYLENSTMPVREILFLDGRPEWGGRFNHSLLDRKQALKIRDLNTLDAFIALVCLARKGELLEDTPLHFVPSMRAYEMLPRILHANKPLRYRWQCLFGCLERILWNRIYPNGVTEIFEMDKVSESLEILDGNSTADCPAGQPQ